MVTDGDHPSTNILLLLFILLAVFFAPALVMVFTSLGPGFAPPEYNAQLLFPTEWGHTGFYSADVERDILISPNKSTDERFSLSGQHELRSSVTFFPRIAPYHGHENYTYNKTGDHYIVEAWHFEDGGNSRTGEEELVRNLSEQGRITPVTLDLSREITSTNDTYFTNATLRRFNASKYESSTTSGYFMALEQPGRTGTFYYIVYFGLIGSRDFSEVEGPLKILLVNRIRYLDDGTIRELVPLSPARPGDIA